MDLSEVLIQVAQGGEHLQAVLAGVGLLWLVHVYGLQVDLQHSQAGEGLLVAVDAAVGHLGLFGSGCVSHTLGRPLPSAGLGWGRGRLHHGGAVNGEVRVWGRAGDGGVAHRQQGGAVAVVTGLWLLVEVHVTAEVLGGGESLRADGAWVAPLVPNVLTVNMVEERPFLGEGLLAVHTP